MALSSCASTGPVTPGEICAEIPFIDGPEGACTHTVTHKSTLVNAQDWKLRRPFMLMIDARYWTEIKKDWLKACRIAGPDCNVQVESIDRVIQLLDSAAKKLLPKLP